MVRHVVPYAENRVIFNAHIVIFLLMLNEHESPEISTETHNILGCFVTTTDIVKILPPTCSLDLTSP